MNKWSNVIQSLHLEFSVFPNFSWSGPFEDIVVVCYFRVKVNKARIVHWRKAGQCPWNLDSSF